RNLFFQQAALSKNNKIYLQQIIACPSELSFRPPPASGFFAINLLHSELIKPVFPGFVKRKEKIP
ncbi:MAG: hypothetical protein P8016_06040, partial [Sedimentisphaerales bacterium]